MMKWLRNREKGSCYLTHWDAGCKSDIPAMVRSVRTPDKESLLGSKGLYVNLKRMGFQERRRWSFCGALLGLKHQLIVSLQENTPILGHSA